jgi:hypothetical protein
MESYKQIAANHRKEIEADTGNVQYNPALSNR